MKIKSICAQLLALILFLTSCNMSDYDEVINGRFHYIGEGSLSNRIEDFWGNEIIPCTIVGYNSNNRYIIAAQIDVSIGENLQRELREDRKMKFWIVDCKDSIVYSQLSYSRFRKLKEKFGMKYLELIIR